MEIGNLGLNQACENKYAPLLSSCQNRGEELDAKYNTIPIEKIITLNNVWA